MAIALGEDSNNSAGKSGQDLGLHLTRNLMLTHEARMEDRDEPMWRNTISVPSSAGLGGIIDALQVMRAEAAEKLAN